MKCPTCGAATQVLDTRGIVRRRECKENPAHRFETVERVSFVGTRQPGRPIGVKAQQRKWDGLK